MSGLNISAEEGVVLLKGEATFSTVVGALQQCMQYSTGSGDLQVDLRGVRRVDSAGVSMLLEWQRRLQRQQRQLRLCNVPHALQRLALIGGVADLLSVGP